MSGQVIPLRQPRTAAEAWEAYVALVRQVDEEPSLRTDLAFNIRIVRAWALFRDLFVAEDEAA